MKKTIKRRLFKGFSNILAGCVVTGGLLLLSTITLEVYAFFAYSDCFFTTSPNFMPLEEAAPILNVFIIVGFTVVFCSMLVGYTSYLLCKTLKKHR